MLNQVQIQLVESKVLAVQRICYAMLLGLLFGAICLSSIANWNNISMRIDALSIIGIVLGTSNFVLSLFIPTLIAQNQRQSINKGPNHESKLEKLADVFQSKILFQFVLLECGSLLNVILFLPTSNLILLGIAACGLSAIAFAIPKTDSVLEWLTDQLNF
ncbi:MAG: hypothetical protein AAGA30_00025 [Planctomycetota bacterium]